MNAEVLSLWPELEWIEDEKLREATARTWELALERSPLMAEDLNTIPFTLLVPKAKENTAAALLAAEKDPSEGGTTSFDKPNVFRGRFELVSDARLDADSTTPTAFHTTPTSS